MKTKLFNELFKWGVLSSIVAVAMPDLALAATGSSSDVNSLIHNVASQQLPALPYILGAVCYVGGSFMLVGGALSLKKHAENPTSEPMAKGISKLLTGGAITAVPALTSVIQKTTTLSGDGASYTTFSQSF